MRANFFLFCILFITLNSCKTSCDCETDCPPPNSEIALLAPENVITIDQLYHINLSNQIKTIDNQIGILKDSITNFPNTSLKERLKELDIRRDSLNIGLTGHAAPPCPAPDGRCCPVLINVSTFTNIRIQTLDPNKNIIREFGDKNVFKIGNKNYVNIEPHDHPHPEDQHSVLDNHCPHRVKITALDINKKEWDFTAATLE